MRRSGRPADPTHPLGYGPERYYWALLAAVGMFVVGGAVSIWEGIRALLHPPELEAFWVGVSVLVIALVARRHQPHRRHPHAQPPGRAARRDPQAAPAREPGPDGHDRLPRGHDRRARRRARAGRADPAPDDRLGVAGRGRLAGIGGLLSLVAVRLAEPQPRAARQPGDLAADRRPAAYAAAGRAGDRGRPPDGVRLPRPARGDGRRRGGRRLRRHSGHAGARAKACAGGGAVRPAPLSHARAQPTGCV